jgi:hypothetical protein
MLPVVVGPIDVTARANDFVLIVRLTALPCGASSSSTLSLARQGRMIRALKTVMFRAEKLESQHPKQAAYPSPLRPRQSPQARTEFHITENHAFRALTRFCGPWHRRALQYTGCSPSSISMVICLIYSLKNSLGASVDKKPWNVQLIHAGQCRAL